MEIYNLQAAAAEATALVRYHPHSLARDGIIRPDSSRMRRSSGNSRGSVTIKLRAQ